MGDYSGLDLGVKGTGSSLGLLAFPLAERHIV
jgi:hypothetical protein